MASVGSQRQLIRRKANETISRKSKNRITARQTYILALQKREKYRLASNIPANKTVSKQENAESKDKGER